MPFFKFDPNQPNKSNRNKTPNTNNQPGNPSKAKKKRTTIRWQSEQHLRFWFFIARELGLSMAELLNLLTEIPGYASELVTTVRRHLRKKRRQAPTQQPESEELATLESMVEKHQVLCAVIHRHSLERRAQPHKQGM